MWNWFTHTLTHPPTHTHPPTQLQNYTTATHTHLRSAEHDEDGRAHDKQDIEDGVFKRVQRLAAGLINVLQFPATRGGLDWRSNCRMARMIRQTAGAASRRRSSTRMPLRRQRRHTTASLNGLPQLPWIGLQADAAAGQRRAMRQHGQAWGLQLQVPSSKPQAPSMAIRRDPRKAPDMVRRSAPPPRRAGAAGAWSAT